MKKIIMILAFVCFGFAAANAQTETKSAKDATSAATNTGEISSGEQVKSGKDFTGASPGGKKAGERKKKEKGMRTKTGKQEATVEEKESESGSDK